MSVSAIDTVSAVRKSKTKPLPIFGGSGEHINFSSVPNRINNGFFFPELKPIIQSGALSLKSKREEQNNSTVASQLLSPVSCIGEMHDGTFL